MLSLYEKDAFLESAIKTVCTKPRFLCQYANCFLKIANFFFPLQP